MALVARREEALKAVAKAALCLGAPDVITLTADVSNPDESKRVVDQTVEHFSKCKFGVLTYTQIKKILHFHFHVTFEKKRKELQTSLSC